MTTDRITVLSSVVSAAIAGHRKREGLSRADFAAACWESGAPESFTATVVGHLESGRRSAGGRRREISLDEAVFLAAAMGTTPLVLLGDHAGLFGADAPAPCSRCEAGRSGRLELTVRADLRRLGDLNQLEPSLAETAYRLSAAVDEADPKELPRLTKELRATLEQIAASRRGVDQPDDPDDDEFDDVDEPE